MNTEQLVTQWSQFCHQGSTDCGRERCASQIATYNSANLEPQFAIASANSFYNLKVTLIEIGISRKVGTFLWICHQGGSREERVLATDVENSSHGERR